MAAKEILNWICKNSINGEFLNIIKVPQEGEEEWEQNEGWWINTFGAAPPRPIPSGEYLYFYESNGFENGMLNENGRLEDSDCVIELSESYGFDHIFLYKIEK